MLHYWAIRQCDLRDLQARLSAYGLSSLGRSEPHVEATLTLVRSAVCAMAGDGWQPPISPGVGIDQGPELLRHRTQDLLGPEPVDRVTRIMVTLPSSAATNPALVRELVERGMNIARINCAHDDAEAWRAMAGHVRRAAEATGQDCLIAMDLAGPKLRTNASAAESRSLDELAARLSRLPGNAAPERVALISSWVGEAADEFSNAPIQVFVPILVEHIVRGRLSKMDADRDARSTQ
jgi:pyruvate kinase